MATRDAPVLKEAEGPHQLFLVREYFCLVTEFKFALLLSEVAFSVEGGRLNLERRSSRHNLGDEHLDALGELLLVRRLLCQLLGQLHDPLVCGSGLYIYILGETRHVGNQGLEDFLHLASIRFAEKESRKLGGFLRRTGVRPTEETRSPEGFVGSGHHRFRRGKLKASAALTQGTKFAQSLGA